MRGRPLPSWTRRRTLSLLLTVTLAAVIALGITIAALLARRRREPKTQSLETAPSTHVTRELVAKVRAHPPESDRLLEAPHYRIISLRTMDNRLRLLALVAIALIAVTAFLVTFRVLPTRLILVQAPPLLGRIPATVPVQLLVLSVVLQAVGISYIVVGLLHASLRVRLVGLGVLTGAWFLDTIFGSGLFGGWGGTIALGGIWAVAAIWVVRDQRAAGAQVRNTSLASTNLLAFPVILALVLSALGLNAWRTGPSNFGSGLALLLSSLAYVTTPMFFRAGGDFGDAASFVSYRLRPIFAKWNPSVVTAMTAVVAVVVLIVAVRSAANPVGGVLLGGLYLAFALTIMLVIRPLGGAAPGTPTSAVVGAAILTFVLLDVVSPAIAGQTSPTTAQVLALPSASPYTFRYEGTPPFTIRAPSGGEGVVVAQEPSSYLKVVFTSDQGWGLFVVALPAGKYPPEVAWRIPFGFDRTLVPGPPTKDGKWLAIPLNGSTDRGIVWVRTTNGRQWLLYFKVFAPDQFDADLPQLVAVRDSWSPMASASAVTRAPVMPGPSQEERYIGITALGWVLVAILASMALSLASRRLRPVAVIALAFLALTGMWVFLTQMADVAAVFGLAPNAATPHLGLSSIEATVALVTLIAISVAVATRRMADAIPLLRLLLAVNFALPIIILISDVYALPRVVPVGELAVIVSALVIPVALLIDIALSGEGITNRQGRHLPRNARVLFYFGYILLVTAALVFFSNLTLRGGLPAGSIFDSELSTEFGILVFGVPLVLTIFLFLAVPRRTSQMGESQNGSRSRSSS